MGAYRFYIDRHRMTSLLTCAWLISILACWLLSRPNWRIGSKLTTDIVTYCTEASNQKSKYAYRKIFFYKKSTVDMYCLCLITSQFLSFSIMLSYFLKCRWVKLCNWCRFLLLSVVLLTLLLVTGDVECEICDEEPETERTSSNASFKPAGQSQSRETSSGK